MILFKGKKFKDYVDFFQYLSYKEETIKPAYFPHNNYFYIRRLLEDKFNKRLSIREIQRLVAEELRLKTITLYEVSQPEC